MDIEFIFNKLSEIFIEQFDYLSLKKFKIEREQDIAPKGYNPYIKLSLNNKELNRRINIFFQLDDYIIFSISDTNKEKFLHLDNYMSFTRGKQSGDYIRLSYFKGEHILDRFTNYCFEIKKLLQTELEDVVIGEKWIEIPIDWSPYK